MKKRWKTYASCINVSRNGVIINTIIIVLIISMTTYRRYGDHVLPLIIFCLSAVTNLRFFVYKQNNALYRSILLEMAIEQ